MFLFFTGPKIKRKMSSISGISILNQAKEKIVLILLVRASKIEYNMDFDAMWTPPGGDIKQSQDDL